jgi:hypothetical protein
MNIDQKIRDFLEIVKNKDPKQIADMVADTVILHTPRFHRPVTDRDHVIAILIGITRVVENLNYSEQRQWHNGRNEIVMEFRGNIGDYQLHGVDIFTFDDDGKVCELTVMCRPVSALIALGEVEDRMLRDHFGISK